jgi:hypothetical protein
VTGEGEKVKGCYRVGENEERKKRGKGEVSGAATETGEKEGRIREEVGWGRREVLCERGGKRREIACVGGGRERKVIR